MKNWCQRALQKGAGEQTNTSQDHLHSKHFISLTLYNHPKRGSAHWLRSYGSQRLRGLGLSPLLSHLRALLHTVRSGSSPPRQGPEHHTLLSVASSSIHPAQTVRARYKRRDGRVGALSISAQGVSVLSQRTQFHVTAFAEGWREVAGAQFTMPREPLP